MIHCELNERGNRIEVRFPYDRDDVARIKRVLGARFVPKDKSTDDQPHWTVPAELESGRELRRVFGDRLRLGPRVREWGTAHVARSKQLRSVASSDTGEVHNLPAKLPDLHRAMHIGPKYRDMTEEERDEAMKLPGSFQLADISFMTLQQNPLNANEMGLGKTPETIGAVFESGCEIGPKLVIAPVAAVEGTWPDELDRWQDQPVFVSLGSAAQKRSTIEEFMALTKEGGSAWLIINPDQVRLRERIERCPRHLDLTKKVAHKRIMDQCPDCIHEYDQPFPALFALDWSAIIVDEAHTFGVMNPKSLTGMGARLLRIQEDGKRIVLSGTPMRGREVNLFSILQFLNPKMFTSKWRWAERYLTVTDNGFGKSIGGIKRCPDHFGQLLHRGDCERCDMMEDQFYESLAPYIVRRTKAECLPDLPPKQYVDVWCDFANDKHRKQYKEFESDGEVVLDGGRVSADIVLAEYARLKRLSWGVCEVRDDGQVYPTEVSGKLRQLEQRLMEQGIFEEGDEQAVIFSQSDDVVNLVTDWLKAKGVKAEKLTGATNKRGQRASLKHDFQSEGGLRVLVITTTAGGTSLTLDRASNVHILDETWNPDDQLQAEDRCHRASRIHQVTVYRYRTKDTIEDYIAAIGEDKSLTNMTVLDLRRILQEKERAA